MHSYFGNRWRWDKYNPLTSLIRGPDFDALAAASSKTKFAAFLHYNCNSDARNTFFRQLNAKKAVDALGRCNPEAEAQGIKAQKWTAGYQGKHDPEMIQAGVKSSYDWAIRKFESYKFVITFENCVQKGYVSEKIVNAFLSKSVPIYFGPRRTIRKMFNTNSFIDCSLPEDPGRYRSNSRTHKADIPQFGGKLFQPKLPDGHFDKCIDRILAIDSDPELYVEMLNSPPFVDNKIPKILTFEHMGTQIGQKLGFING